MQELLGRVMFLDLICLKFFMTCVGVAKRVLLFPFFNLTNVDKHVSKSGDFLCYDFRFA